MLWRKSGVSGCFREILLKKQPEIYFMYICIKQKVPLFVPLYLHS